MKKYILKLFCVLLMVCSSCLVSCSSDDDHYDEPAQEEARYYVKYEVHMNINRSALGVSIQCQGDKKEEHFSTKNPSWEGTFGPFKKGQEVFLRVYSAAVVTSTSDSYVRISVSRDKEPFVLREELRRSDSTKSYEISAIVE